MSFRPLLVGLPLVAGLLAVTGCAAPDDSDIEDVGTSEDAIKGGYADPNDPNVVGIYSINSGGICSGSLIAPNLVLTARHCVAPVLNEVGGGVQCGVTKFGTTTKGSNLVVTTEQFMSPSAKFHVGSEVIVPADKAFCGNDVALIILGNNIDPSEAVPLVPRVDTQIAKQDEYSAVGYGATGDSGSGAGQRRRRDKLFTTCIADECPPWMGGTELEWVGDQGICQGDSGGPAIDLQNRVIGITSRGSAGCDNPVYGGVFSWAQLIKDAAFHAAEVGGYAPPPWATGWTSDPQFPQHPVGDACAQPADCPSNHCISDASGQYCTRACGDTAPCPDGYVCDAGNLGVCVQVFVPPPPTPAEKKAAEATETGGCNAAPSPDPTKPVPWFAGGAVIAFALLRRRRR